MKFLLTFNGNQDRSGHHDSVPCFVLTPISTDIRFQVLTLFGVREMEGAWELVLRPGENLTRQRECF